MNSSSSHARECGPPASPASIKNSKRVSLPARADPKVSLYEAAHTSCRSIDEQADHLHVSAGYLYRALLPFGESSCRYPLDLFAQHMEFLDDFSPLDALNARFGRVVVSLGRARAVKRGGPVKAILQIETRFNELMVRALEFLEVPNRASIAETRLALRRCLSEIAALRIALEAWEQAELF